MEARKITIVSTKTQKKSVIMSEAETLAELKVDLANAGIDYNDMTFYEGVSKTELRHDNSVLPKDVPYTNRRTGETKVTNELVFMLTNVNKKIASGMSSRSEIYIEIRNLGLEGAVKDTYGKNYTNCTTEELRSVVENAREFLDDVTQYEEEHMECCGCKEVENLKATVDYLINVLFDNDCIDYTEFKGLCNRLNRGVNEPDSSYSDDEIDEMMEDMDL